MPPARQRVGLVPLYPMGVGDVLDTAFRMLRATAGPAVLVVLLLFGPLQVASSAGFQSPFPSFSEPVPEVIDPRLVGLALVAGLASLLVTPLVQAALTWLGAHADASGAPSWQDALRHGARHYWRTLGALALLALVMVGLVAVGIGVVALLAVAGGPILGVVVGVPLALGGLLAAVAVTMLGYLTVPCVVVEELGPVHGLRRAGRLLRARFWPTVGLSLLIGLLLMLLGGAVSSVISIPAFFGLPGAWAFIAVGSILDQLVRAPLGAYAALAIHVDQRIRTEGYDVEVLVSELRR